MTFLIGRFRCNVETGRDINSSFFYCFVEKDFVVDFIMHVNEEEVDLHLSTCCLMFQLCRFFLCTIDIQC
ncbi:hypothetical protein T4D_8937 [Trichinella pseudospiralis]|uniref:Uncharacterized protein n=1 Tax=Trichinella pseudospiralis TaxID=6337 RepID=A0A0V1FE91_TRIPS|nr:hypothetical protein T4D_8937 [Trichinella pseudospiralis]